MCERSTWQNVAIVSIVCDIYVITTSMERRYNILRWYFAVTCKQTQRMSRKWIWRFWIINVTCDRVLQNTCTDKNNCVWKFEAQCYKKWNNHDTCTCQNWHFCIKMKGALTLQDNGGEVATFVCTLCWPDTKHNVTFNSLIVLYLVFDLIHDVYIIYN